MYQFQNMNLDKIINYLFLLENKRVYVRKFVMEQFINGCIANLYCKLYSNYSTVYLNVIMTYYNTSHLFFYGLVSII